MPENSFINPTNTGYQFDSVFICQSYKDSIIALNLGTKDLILDKIFIINQKPPGPSQFSFDNGVDSLIVNSVFHPIEGWDTATIICYWDSAGVKTVYSENLLIGYGAIAHAAISTPLRTYSGKSLDTIDIPISLSEDLSGPQTFSYEVIYPPKSYI